MCPPVFKGEVFMKTCLKISRYIRRGMFVISGAFIGMATALAALNALLRFFGLGLSWADELYVYFIVLMVYIGLPQLEGTGDQLCITAIDSWVKNQTAQKILNYIRGVITSVALCVIAYYGFNVMLKAFKRNQLTYILQLPKGILYGIATLCLFITVLIWLVIMICNKGEFDHDTD